MSKITYFSKRFATFTEAEDFWSEYSSNANVLTLKMRSKYLKKTGWDIVVFGTILQ